MTITNTSPTSIGKNINDEMQAILDRYLPGRRPMSPR